MAYCLIDGDAVDNLSRPWKLSKTKSRTIKFNRTIFSPVHKKERDKTAIKMRKFKNSKSIKQSPRYLS